MNVVFMGKRGDYRKAIASATARVVVERRASDAVITLERWLRGVPFAYMTSDGRRRFEKNVVEKLQEFVVDEYVRSRVEMARDLAPRWRPAYDRVAEWLYNYDNLRKIAGLRPVEAYRLIAHELGISWRTVRDAFWAFRYGRLEMW